MGAGGVGVGIGSGAGDGVGAGGAGAGGVGEGGTGAGGAGRGRARRARCWWRHGRGRCFTLTEFDSRAADCNALATPRAVVSIDREVNLASALTSVGR